MPVAPIRRLAPRVILGSFSDMSKIWAAHLAARLLTRQDISVESHMRPLPGKVNLPDLKRPAFYLKQGKGGTLRDIQNA
jgi:hypothetical protein